MNIFELIDEIGGNCFICFKIEKISLETTCRLSLSKYFNNISMDLKEMAIKFCTW